MEQKDDGDSQTQLRGVAINKNLAVQSARPNTPLNSNLQDVGGLPDFPEVKSGVSNSDLR